MREFEEFFNNLVKESESIKSGNDRKVLLPRVFLHNLNRFFFQGFEYRGTDYISKFHKFWEKNHKRILQPRLATPQIKKVANILENVFEDPERFETLELSPPLDHGGITKRQIANVRFFTAIQDFRTSISRGKLNPFRQYRMNPEWFGARKIIKNPDIINPFLVYLKVQGSQVDKRANWMIEAANFLIKVSAGDAYKLNEVYKGNALAIQKALAAQGNIGYSEKKANMFLRDMADWGIWEYRRNYDKIDVASDSNTMRVALRTGILRTAIPILASYLDIYCYQYGLIGSYTRLAWRKVWEVWRMIPGNHCPSTPASMDYLLYHSIGKKLCKINKVRCADCIFDTVCPSETRNLKPPRSISIWGATGWESGRTDKGGGGGIMS